MPVHLILWKRIQVSILTLLVLMFFSCQTAPKKAKTIDTADYLTESLLRCEENLTETIVPDILSPPFASRVYVYPCIAAYEALLPAFPAYQSLAGQLNDLPPLPLPDSNKVCHFELAAITAFNRVAKKMVWTELKIEQWDSVYRQSVEKRGVDPEVMKYSIIYGNQIGDSILAWASRDHFKQTRSMTRYALSDTVGAWKTTPPDYMAAVEPYWGTHRPFALLAVDQFAPPMEFPRYSENKNTPYQKAVQEVYEISKSLDTEKVHIAKFWDCNPNVSKHEGHLTVFSQKLTPGGHWLSIVNTLSRNKRLNIMQAAEAMALTSVALADGFMCCWHWKYKCNTIRPVTVINQMIDNDWHALLQTPPFPEYPSGHSTITGAASTVLIRLFGDTVSFTDSSEVEFGLPVRSFTSLTQAAEEVSISRVYGGIHYRFSCENGLALGREIGAFINERIKTKR